MSVKVIDSVVKTFQMASPVNTSKYLRYLRNNINLIQNLPENRKKGSISQLVLLDQQNFDSKS